VLVTGRATASRSQICFGLDRLLPILKAETGAVALVAVHKSLTDIHETGELNL
jgi:hypothetical protein